jgi:hypothetical protein
MLPIGHFSLGVTVAIVFLLLINSEKLYKYDLLIMFGFGYLSLFPDIGILWGDIWLDDNPIFNIFFLHPMIDEFTGYNNTNSDIIFAGIFMVICVIFLIIYVYYKRFKKKINN